MKFKKTSNIFVTFPDPKESANFIIDTELLNIAIVGVVKLLNSAVLFYKGPKFKTHNSLKSINFKHPIFLWTKNTRDNFRWACLYFNALCKNFYDIYKEEHYYSSLIKWYLKDNVHFIPLGELQPFVNYTPYPDLHVYSAYQKYLTETWFDKTFKNSKEFFNDKELKTIDNLYQNVEL